MKKNRLCELLDIKYPVIQAPMAWITNAELVAAVSNAGGLGVLGPCAGQREMTTDIAETGERMRREIIKVKEMTKKSFGINIVVDPPGTPELIRKFGEETLKVALEEKVPVAVLTGHTPEFTRILKDAGIKVIFRASPVSIEIAKESEKMGVDAFVAVGFEGGGHVGTDRTPGFMLFPQIADAVKIPVVAGGGISYGRQLAAVMALGAEGIYMGTRFIASTECPAHPRVKKSICEADYNSTVTCTGIIGVLRALKNPMMERCIEMELAGATPAEVTELYSGGFREGLQDGDIDNGLFSFGMGAGIIKETKRAGEIVRDIIREADQVISGF